MNSFKTQRLWRRRALQTAVC